jgi:hypothetical protein
MAKNPRISQLDYQQAMRHSIDEENDALRVIVINPDVVKKEEVNANLKELIDVIKNKEEPKDRTDYSKLVNNIEKLTEASLKKDDSKEVIPGWIKYVMVLQAVCSFGILLLNIIK